MDSYALTTDGRPVSHVERDLRRYLPGLDVRLQRFSATQAIVPSHLLRALRIDYRDAASLLRSFGVERLDQVSDADVVALLRTRDVRNLERRAAPAIALQRGVDWHLALCNVDRAWPLIGGPDAIDWTGVSVGQIDTGYTRHPAYGFPQAPWVKTTLARTFWPPPPAESPTEPPPELGAGLDNLSGLNGGHGTKTGCTIAGRAPDGSFYGVAPKVPLVPVRICNTVVINDRQAQFDMAVRHLVDVAKVNVINVSLGLFPSTPTKQFKHAIDYAYDNGVIVVCAAGNHVRSVVAPASMRRTLAIGGITREDVPWSGSSHGPEVDLSAPAADVRRAVTAPPGDKFSYSAGGDGTSYATAIVSGAAALWLVRHRASLSQAYTQRWQVVEAFKKAVMSSTRQPANWQPGSFGTGVLDAKALLEFPLPAAGTLTADASNA